MVTRSARSSIVYLIGDIYFLMYSICFIILRLEQTGCIWDTSYIVSHVCVTPCLPVCSLITHHLPFCSQFILALIIPGKITTTIKVLKTLVSEMVSPVDPKKSVLLGNSCHLDPSRHLSSSYYSSKIWFPRQLLPNCESSSTWRP